MTENKTLNSFILASALILVSSSIVSAHRPSYEPESGVIEQCDYPGIDGLFVTNDRYAYSNASLACESYGGALADITNQNYLLGADMALTCIGPNNRVWIGSWDFKDVGTDLEKGVYDCLSLVVGNIGPGAGVDKNCEGILPVLCQNYPTVVLHNPLYSQAPWPGLPQALYSLPTLPPVSVFEDDEDKEMGYPVLYPDLNAAVYRPMALPLPPPPQHQPKQALEQNLPSYPVLYPFDDNVYQGNPEPTLDVKFRQYDKSYLRDANLRGDYRKPLEYIREGPKGGFPGGIFPGGPGFGSGGYPFGYPWNYHGQHGSYESSEVDCETVAIDGMVTTISVESVSSATVVI